MSRPYRTTFALPWITLLTLITVRSVAGCGDNQKQEDQAPDDGPTRVRLALNWFPEAELTDSGAVEVQSAFTAAFLP